MPLADQGSPPVDSTNASEPRHAIYMNVYKEPELVERIVRRLQHPRLDVHLHVDSAVDETPFHRAPASRVPVRFRTAWASWEVTGSILHWLRMVRKDGYRTFTYLSGQCYPVYDAERIVRELDLVEGWMQGMNPAPQNHEWRYRYFHVLAKTGRRGFRDRLLKKLWFRERPIRKLPEGLRWGTGCAHWAMDLASVEWMLDLLDARPEIEGFFRNVFASDETFFSTLAMSSPWADPIGRNTHYWDWSAGGSHPKNLDEGDLQAILDSGHWFARKIVPGHSDKLLDLLDQGLAAR